MRTIKFRAWDKEMKWMRTVEKINFEDETIFSKVKDNGVGTWLMFSEIELMQFTGLLDKNGKEIYEGDILKAWHPTAVNDQAIGEVIWATESYAGWKFKPKNESQILLGFGIPEKHYEIIGNIYENPELLSNPLTP